CVTLWAGAPAAASSQKEEPKKEQPKKANPDDDLVPPLPDIIVPPGIDPAQAQRIQEQLKMIREAMRKQMEELRKISPDDFPALPPALQLPPAFAGIERRPREGRLGAVVEAPTPALVDQLDLPRD